MDKKAEAPQNDQFNAGYTDTAQAAIKTPVVHCLYAMQAVDEVRD